MRREENTEKGKGKTVGAPLRRHEKAGEQSDVGPFVENVFTFVSSWT